MSREYNNALSLLLAVGLPYIRPVYVPNFAVRRQIGNSTSQD
jgi:hypothetical protein